MKVAGWKVVSDGLRDTFRIGFKEKSEGDTVAKMHKLALQHKRTEHTALV